MDMTESKFPSCSTEKEDLAGVFVKSSSACQQPFLSGIILSILSLSLSHTQSSPSHPSETGHVRTSSQSDEQRESRELIRDKKRPLASHILPLSLLQYTRCQSKGK